MSYIITIPTLGRPNEIKLKTLAFLKRENIPDELIHVYVVPEEEAIYRSTLEGFGGKIIVGKMGLTAQRNFINTQYPKDAWIVGLDDDVESWDNTMSDRFKTSTLNDFFISAFEDCIAERARIWSVYPVFNPFFRNNRQERTLNAVLCIGAFHGIINLPNRTLPDEINEKEDVYRSVQYFLKDGRVIRYNRIGFVTKYYGATGGLGNFKSRIARANTVSHYILSQYPQMGKVLVKKSGMTEFKIKPVKPFEPVENIVAEIKLLPEIPAQEFSVLYELLCGITLAYKNGKNNRRGFPKHRAQVFGMTKQRIPRKNCPDPRFGLSAYSKRYPEVYQELLRIGKEYCQIPFNSIHVNHNVTCPKHKDAKNVGDSVLLSFGEYTGGNIIIEGVKYNAFCQPIQFNGALLEHWNSEDLVGNKYSLVFFTSTDK